MTKDLFQQIFSTKAGHVYRYVGVAHDTDPITDITKQFVVGLNDPLISTVVVELRGTYVLYTNIQTIVENPAFEHLTDLADPIIEQLPVEDIPPASEGTV